MLRVDRAPFIVQGTAPFERTPEGYLKGRAVVTSTGVFEYMNADGNITRELRLPEEVFAQDFLKSLCLKPLTFTHPKDKVDATNAKDLAVGMLGENPSGLIREDGSKVESDNYHVAVDIIITDADAIKAVESGIRALSVGYSCDLVKADDDARWCGIPYDYIQKNLRANHVSIVDRGRQGDAAIIRMDALTLLNDIGEKGREGDAIRIDSPDASILVPTEEVNVDNKLRTINLDGVDYQAEDKVIDAFKASATRADELQSKIDALTSDKSALEAERDKQKERADTLTVELEALKKNHLDADKLPELIKNRVALEKIAEKIGIEKADEMSDMDIMVAVIKAKAPKANPEKLTDAVYVKARFDGIVEDMGNEEAQKADEAVRVVSGSRADSMDEKSADAARKAMIERERNAFRAGK